MLRSFLFALLMGAGSLMAAPVVLSVQSASAQEDGNAEMTYEDEAMDASETTDHEDVMTPEEEHDMADEETSEDDASGDDR